MLRGVRIYAQGGAKAQGGAARPPEKLRGVRPVRGAPPETASVCVELTLLPKTSDLSTFHRVYSVSYKTLSSLGLKLRLMRDPFSASLSLPGAQLCS